MSEVAVLNRPMVPQVQEPPRSTMDMVAEAVARGANIEVIEKLMGLHERFEAAQARRAFDEAMALAKAEIKPVKKNRHVGYEHRSGEGSTDYDHEDLAQIAGSVDPILAKHGLSYRFRTKQAQQISVICIIAHRGGHSEENELFAPADTSGKKNPIQAIGSTITYLQRYTLKAALGLAAAKDDDGRAAGGDEEKITEEQVQQLIDLADDRNIDKARFCKFMKVNALPDILKKNFDFALKQLDIPRRADA